jgi:hypothetical protein
MVLEHPSLGVPRHFCPTVRLGGRQGREVLSNLEIAAVNSKGISDGNQAFGEGQGDVGNQKYFAVSRGIADFG